MPRGTLDRSTAALAPAQRPRPVAGPFAIGTWIVAVAILIAAIAAVCLVASFWISYAAVRQQLVALYGAAQTDRYFNTAIFQSMLLRLRAGSAALIGVAVVLFASRKFFARLLQPFVAVMVLSFRHLRRYRGRRLRLAWNLPVAVALSLISLVAVLIRAAFLQQPIRYDEAATVLGYASKPFYLGLSVYNEPNNHLLHTLMVHIAMQIFGASVWAVRLPAFLAGALLPVFAFIFAAKLVNRNAGLLAAALVATSSILIEYSTNARGYTMVCVATLALLICALESLSSASAAWLTLFALCAIAGAWTIPIFMIPVGGAVIWLLWETHSRSGRFQRIWRRRLILTLAGTAAAIVCLYLPVIVVNGPSALFKNPYVSPARSIQALVSGNRYELHNLWQSWNRDLPGWWPVVMMAAFAYSVVRYPRIRRLAISLAGWAILLVITRRYVAFARTWLMFLPIYLVFASAGLAGWIEMLVRQERLRLSVMTAASAALAIVLAIFVQRSGTIAASTETGVLQSAREITEFFDARAVAPDQVLSGSISELPLRYYWWKRAAASYPLSLARRSDLKTVEAKGMQDAWLVVNPVYNESVARLMSMAGVTKCDVLEEHPFRGASVYHVVWERGQRSE